ncbi:MAG: VOC family protein [Saprospiraceae bacterium]|nr:VOC family protein [Saprospiraceae bacterium]MBK8827544.1 VOC family protein [Saprospiraceae bacterium]MBK9583401.1 VOC family protein [Saprospiraceae bacterium]HQV66456.1 VOC family protein [Saprospiraceae bacterium]HQV98662.1 VOC family protein [Saprospiraceae bacterium]
MTTVNVYLNFDGQCEEAFSFYKSVFGGEFSYIGRFNEMPQDENIKLSEADGNKIMHVSLPISAETNLFGSDTVGAWSPKLVQGNNYSISINASSKEEADRLFNGLSAGGQVTMPLENTFWGAYFGMFVDKYGINWMVNFDENPA